MILIMSIHDGILPSHWKNYEKDNPIAVDHRRDDVNSFGFFFGFFQGALYVLFLVDKCAMQWGYGHLKRRVRVGFSGYSVFLALFGFVLYFSSCELMMWSVGNCYRELATRLIIFQLWKKHSYFVELYGDIFAKYLFVFL